MIGVQQSVRRSPALESVVNWTLGVWVGVPGGSAIGTDADPNVTPPSASRIVIHTNGRSRFWGTGLSTMRVQYGNLVVGASTGVTVYWFDDSRGRWVEERSFTLTTAGLPANNLIIPAMGCRAFLRVTSNTLGQCVGYGFQ